MKLKDLMEKYGEREIAEFDFEEAFEKLDHDENDGAVLIEVLKKKPKTIWDLEEGDNYILETDTGGIMDCEVRHKEIFEKSREVGNIFLDQYEAEKDIERRKVETLLLKYGGRRWFKSGKENWFISFDCSSGLFKSLYTIREHRTGVIYFDTEEQAEKAINEIGEERIKKALFEVR